MVAGEEEASSGTIDIRTRDNVRHGKMRIDELAAMLQKEKPDLSKSHTNMYAKAWDPANFVAKVESVAEQVEKVAEKVEA